MLKRLLIFCAGAALGGGGCYEPGPAPPPPPAWYWHPGFTNADFYDLASTARDDAWVVGVSSSGVGQVFRYTGFQWNHSDLPQTTVGPLYAVATLDNGDAWAVGGGDYIFYWNGSRWFEWPHPKPGLAIYGLALVNDTLGWAVGQDGLILKFDGVGWTEVVSPTAETLRRVRALSPDAAWAVGDGGAVLRYSGGSWEEVAFGPSVDLYDLYFAGANDVWVVGDVAAVYHWDGATFKKFQVPPVAAGINFRCCGFLTPDKGWAGGGEAHLVRYDGSSWQLEQYMPSAPWALNAIHFVSDTEGWAVGPDGYILHYY